MPSSQLSAARASAATARRRLDPPPALKSARAAVFSPWLRFTSAAEEAAFQSFARRNVRGPAVWRLLLGTTVALAALLVSDAAGGTPAHWPFVLPVALAALWAFATRKPVGRWPWGPLAEAVYASLYCASVVATLLVHPPGGRPSTQDTVSPAAYLAAAGAAFPLAVIVLVVVSADFVLMGAGASAAAAATVTMCVWKEVPAGAGVALGLLWGFTALVGLLAAAADSRASRTRWHLRQSLASENQRLLRSYSKAALSGRSPAAMSPASVLPLPSPYGTANSFLETPTSGVHGTVSSYVGHRFPSYDRSVTDMGTPPLAVAHHGGFCACGAPLAVPGRANSGTSGTDKSSAVAPAGGGTPDDGKVSTARPADAPTTRVRALSGDPVHRIFTIGDLGPDADLDTFLSSAVVPAPSTTATTRRRSTSGVSATPKAHALLLPPHQESGSTTREPKGRAPPTPANVTKGPAGSSPRSDPAPLASVPSRGVRRGRCHHPACTAWRASQQAPPGPPSDALASLAVAAGVAVHSVTAAGTAVAVKEVPEEVVPPPVPAFPVGTCVSTLQDALDKLQDCRPTAAGKLIEEVLAMLDVAMTGSAPPRGVDSTGSLMKAVAPSSSTPGSGVGAPLAYDVVYESQPFAHDHYTYGRALQHEHHSRVQRMSRSVSTGRTRNDSQNVDGLETPSLGEAAAPDRSRPGLAADLVVLSGAASPDAVQGSPSKAPCVHRSDRTETGWSVTGTVAWVDPRSMEWMYDIRGTHRIARAPSAFKPRGDDDLRRSPAMVAGAAGPRQSYAGVVTRSRRSRVESDNSNTSDAADLAVAGFSPACASVARRCLSWSFDVREFVQVSGGRPLEVIGMHTVSQFDLFRTLGIKPSAFQRYLSIVERTYCYEPASPNPYHSAMHGADVAQAVAALMTRLAPSPDAHFTPLDQFALLFSAIIHDYRHTGTNNNFLVGRGDEIALRYNDQSVLENFSVAEAFRLMYDTKLFPDLMGMAHHSNLDFTHFRKTVVSCVLATDLSIRVDFSPLMSAPDVAAAAATGGSGANTSSGDAASVASSGVIRRSPRHSLSRRSSVSRRGSAVRLAASPTSPLSTSDVPASRVSSKVAQASSRGSDAPASPPEVHGRLEVGSDGEDAESGDDGDVGALAAMPAEPILSAAQRLCLAKLLLKVGDVSHPTRPLATHLRWFDALQLEFAAQGEQELALGMPVSPLCDPTVTNVAPSQLGFINFVVQPICQVLQRYQPGYQWLLDNLQANYRYWEERGKAFEAAPGTAGPLADNPDAGRVVGAGVVMDAGDDDLHVDDLESLGLPPTP